VPCVLCRVVNIKVSSIADKLSLSPILLNKSIDKVSPILFLARYIDTKLQIFSDEQGQTTLGGLILQTKCDMERMFHQLPLLMRVELQGSQVMPIARSK